MLPRPSDKVMAKTEKKKEEENAEEPTENAVNENATPKKPFEFRERLVHEPPEHDYERYEIWDDVQKEFKKLGGPHLQYRTLWLDHTIEDKLIVQYLA